MTVRRAVTRALRDKRSSGLAAFVSKRLSDDWKLLAAIFLGITIAAALLAGAPIYISTLERQGIDTAIDRANQSYLNIYAASPYITLDGDSLDATEHAFDQAIVGNVAEMYRGRVRFLKSPTFLVGTPQSPLMPIGQAPEEGERVSRGYFQHIERLENHVTFLHGRMASDEVVWEDGRPIIEAIIGQPAQDAFDLEIGHRAVFAPSLSDPMRAVVEIVGVVEPTDPSEEYWQQNPNVFLDPAPLEELPDAEVEVDPEEPPLPVFVTRAALVNGVGRAYPGTLVNSSWFVFVDREGLKTWDKEEVRSRLDAMEAEVSVAMPGSVVLTGIRGLLDSFEKRSFFTSVPLLLLLVVTAMTVLYYILMMVSYLVSSREADVALLRSRGVSSWQLTRIYALEGLSITVIAAVIAPFLAMGSIALVGRMGYFEDITLGEYLPVSMELAPFLVSGGVGLLCLAIYVVPGVVGARTGLIVHKLRSSRPPAVPLFQRYYIDVGLMVIGGLVFWELFARGQIISGGLFGERGVNEALLFAPVLLLTVVALLFMRFFPLVVRYLSGDSPTLMHLVAAATLVGLAFVIAVQEVRAGAGAEVMSALGRIAHLGLIGLIYWWTWRRRTRADTFSLLTPLHSLLIILQAALIALFIYYGPVGAGLIESGPIYGGGPAASLLIALVPLQIAYLALRALSRVYPVWVSMSIWRMARNPLQYSWLVLLIVMVTGLGVLATTVGGTLDRSYEERILYEVASDLRVTGVPTHFARGTEEIKERYLTMPGVSSVSLALRGEGSVGATYSGNSFGVLAVESDDFPYVTWYRDDFSERPLPQVMSLLRSGANVPSVDLPEGADGIYVWTRTLDDYPNMFLWMVVQDHRGVTDTITFGPVTGTEWTLRGATIPYHMQPPLSLVSVQIYEPAFGPAGTAGTLLLDDIQASVRGSGERHVLEDFEGVNRWTPLSTSMISTDTLWFGRPGGGSGVKNGARSGVFTFGKDTDRGIRGFYRSPTGGPVPVIASSSFTRRTGTVAGDAIIVNVFGRLIPVRIMDVVEYFPTMNPSGNGFLIADLDGFLRHLNILTPIGSIRPNELMLRESPGAGDEAYEYGLALARSPHMVHDRDRLLEEVRLDPLITAGWRAMALVAFAVIVFVSALGYVTYLISFAGESRAETGFLQALGLRRGQMTRLLGAEHLVVVCMGLALGTAAGFAMSDIMVSALAVTEDGLPVIPPFVLTTDWGFMGPIYVALVVTFVGALLWLARSVSRVNVTELSRLEG